MNEQYEVQPTTGTDGFGHARAAYKVVDSATGRVKYDNLPTAAHAHKMRDFAEHCAKPLVP